MLPIQPDNYTGLHNYRGIGSKSREGQGPSGRADFSEPGGPGFDSSSRDHV